MLTQNTLTPVGRYVLAGIIAVSLYPTWSYAKDKPKPQTGKIFDRLRAEHQLVLDQLNTQGEKAGPVGLGDPQVPALLKQGWALAGQWAATYLDSHPVATARELARIFDGFAPEPKGVKAQYGDFLEYHTYSFVGSAVRIAPAVYVVEARYWMENATSAFLVVARKEKGRFQPLWNIKDLAEKHYPERDEIGRWLHLTSRAYYNGPLDVDKILPVAHSANGHPRFLVNAHESADGGTALAQLSIWEWNDTEAVPLLIDTYEFARNYGGFHFDGETLRITTKQETRAFSSCGMCTEPRGTWTIRITPEGVKDLGHRFVQPEIQWADKLLSRVNTGAGTADLASPKVDSALKTAIQENKAEFERLTGEPLHEFSWGMMDRCRVRRRGPEGGSFELVLDEALLRFTYSLRDGKPYFTDVRVVGR